MAPYDRSGNYYGKGRFTFSAYCDCNRRFVMKSVTNASIAEETECKFHQVVAYHLTSMQSKFVTRHGEPDCLLHSSFWQIANSSSENVI